ncbi:MAG: hypothetical protein Q8R28_00760 [Dehalococcoidia bacterium]|nr:hypothetical protein [Dehalococcoidia bacterium]
MSRFVHFFRPGVLFIVVLLLAMSPVPDGRFLGGVAPGKGQVYAGQPIPDVVLPAAPGVNSADKGAQAGTTPRSGSAPVVLGNGVDPAKQVLAALDNKVYLPYSPKTYISPVSDDFSDPTSGWTVLVTDHDSRGYDAGEYRIFINSGNKLAVPFRELYATDLQVEIDARAAGPTSGNYGIHFGSTDVGLYAFLVSSGQYLLGRYEFATTTWTYLINWTANSSILTGNSANRLKVVRMGSTISVYANGQQLAQVTDSTHGIGYVGPAAGGFAPNFEARFDNFLLIYTPAAP